MSNRTDTRVSSCAPWCPLVVLLALALALSPGMLPAQEDEPQVAPDEVTSEEASAAIEQETGAEGGEEDAATRLEAELAAEREARQRDAERRERERTVRRDAQVSFGSSVIVAEDEIGRAVVSIGGSVRVDGEVLEDAVAIGGPVRVNGTVSGTAVSVGNSVYLGPEAKVGDVVAVGGRVHREPGAEVYGQVNEVAIGRSIQVGWWPFDVASGRAYDIDDFRYNPFEMVFETFWGVLCILILLLFASGFVLLARKPLERVERKVRNEPFQAGLAGFLAQILCGPFFLLVILILVISIIGIPLLILVPIAVLALLVAAFMGYTAVAYRLGQWLRERFGWDFAASPYLALAVGVIVLQVWSLISDLLDHGHGPLWFFAIMLGIFGFMVQYLAWTVGFGAVLLTRFGTSDSWRREPGPPPHVPPTRPAHPAPPTPEQVSHESGVLDLKEMGAQTSPEGSEPDLPRGSESSDQPETD